MILVKHKGGIYPQIFIAPCGAHELKPKMGFVLEDNGAIAFTPVNLLLRKFANKLAKIFWS
jgi:hypothetical protein